MLIIWVFLYLLLASLQDVLSQATTQTTSLPITPPNLGNRTVIRMGIAANEAMRADSVGYSITGGAIGMAIDLLNQREMINAYTFEAFVNYTDCDQARNTGAAINFFEDLDVDVVIAAPCNSGAEPMARLSTYYNRTVLAWGFVTDYDFTLVTEYPTLTNIMQNTYSLGVAATQVLEAYQFDRIAILYTSNDLQFCDGVIDDFELAINSGDYDINIAYKQKLPLTDAITYESILRNAKQRARIFILCLDSAIERLYFAANASTLGMNTEEYVYILISVRALGFGTGQIASSSTTLSSGLSPFWDETDANNVTTTNTLAREAASRFLVVDVSSAILDRKYYDYFMSHSMTRVREWPTYCQTQLCLNNTNTTVPGYARHLHDVVYLYGIALNQTLNPEEVKDPNLMLNRMQTTFTGLSGLVSITQNNSRDAVFLMYALNNAYDEVAFANISFDGESVIFTTLYKDESDLWRSRGGSRPLSTPRCGFLGTSCPKAFWNEYLVYVVVGGCLIILLILIALAFIAYGLRQRQLELKREKAEWQIPFAKLQKPPTKKDHLSRRSLQSGPSTITGDSSKFTFESAELSNYKIYIYEKEPVLTTKHNQIDLFRKENEHFSKLRKLDHENVNKFVGLSIDGVEFIAVWRMCGRGSLQEVISKGSLNMDQFFVFCLIRDLAEGLNYLHSSFLTKHGTLRSSSCLVNESWQVKIGDYGLEILSPTNTSKKNLLWVAPEHIQSGSTSPEGDVYSFAIICSEIITKRPAWNLGNRSESLDELLYLIRKGGVHPIRPDLTSEGLEIGTALLHLVRDCWVQNPADRPSMSVVCNLLRGMMPRGKGNLFDHVFGMLEDYTTTLEREVDERTKELATEKKKADILLSRMLPRQVAERLKLGQAVEPESFDSVTVFFSDIVKFTQLATKSTPFEVVNLLNDLYNRFDTLIEEHNVYKVESIGDGYLCVSGLPERNGVKHVKEISDLSLAFMDCVKQFKIPHLSRDRIELRIGINSGPCVAGVVGLTMPRYCLFGDTVNTASRMESNGKASHIHMSSAAHNLLTREFPGQYETHSRGDVIIKGKGVMETFWLLSKVKQDNEEIRRSALASALKRAPLAKQETENGFGSSVIDSEKEENSSERTLKLENVKDADNLTVPLYRQFRQDALSSL